MSTTSANPAKSIKQAAATANGSVSRETLLDYLNTAAKSMRRLELGIGIVVWLTTLLLLLVAAVFIDHWVVPLNTLARFAVCGLLIAWTAWWVPRRVIPLLFQPIHPEHAARTIEKLYPSMKESLISWLQLSTTDDRTPRGVLAVVARFAARNLNGAESASVLDTGALLKLSSFFAVCLFAFIIYIVAAPKSSVVAMSRIMMPWASISPASRVVITEVKPGTTKITQGTNLPISIGTRGMYQQDEVYLRYDLSDGQKVGQRIRMKTDVEGLSYSINFGEGMGGIHQPLSYWVEAGDAVAGPFGVKIQTVPIVAVDRLELQFPKYTKLKDRTIQKDGSCEVPEGTRLRIFAHANQPMEKSRIEFDPIIERGVLVHTSGLLDLKTQGTEIEGEWIAKLNEEKKNPTLSKYQIKATNSLGERNDSPVIYSTNVLADLPPVVRLQSELPSMIELPQDQRLEIEIRTNDPDYGLTLVSAIGKSPNSLSNAVPMFESTLFESSEGSFGQKVLKYDFSPTELGLQINTEVEFTAKAADNRCKPGTDNPEPNVSYSSPIKIKVVKALKQPAENAKKPQNAANNEKNPEGKNQKNPTPEPNQDPKKQGQGENSSQQTEPADPPNEKNEKSEPSQDKDQKSKGSSSGEQSSKGNEKPSDKKNQKGSGSSGDGNSEQSGSAESNEDQAGGSNKSGNQSKTSKKSNGSSSGSGNSSSSDSNDSDSADGSKSGNNQSSTEKSSKPDNKSSSGDPSKSSKEKSSEQSGAPNQEQGNKEGGEASKETGDTSTAPSKPEHDGERFDAINELREKREREKQEGAGNSGNKGSTSNQPSGTKEQSSSKEEQSGKSESGKSESGKSESGKPESGKSESGKSESGKSESGKSESGKSESGKSESGKPESGKSESGKSESGKSESGKSESGKSESGKSESGKPESGKPESGKSEPGKSEPGKSESGKSESGKSESGKSESGKSESGKSESGKSESGKSESGKSESGKSESGKSESGKSESGKSESGKSESGKSESGKSESGKSESGKSEYGKSEYGKSESGKSESGKSESGKSESGKSESGKSESGKSESGKSESGKSESGKSGREPGDSKSSSSSAKGQSPQGAKGPSNSADSGQPKQPDAEIKPPEAPSSTEYADELTDLALEYLKEQREQPDPELLRRLDWTKNDMQKFLDRWTQAKEEAKTNSNKKQELEAALRSLGLKSSKSQAKKSSDRDDLLKGYLENGSRTRPPESIREKVEKFRRAADKINQ